MMGRELEIDENHALAGELAGVRFRNGLGLVPSKMEFDTNLDGKADLVLPIYTATNGNFDGVGLGDGKNAFGISGKLIALRDIDSSLNSFKLNLKSPTPSDQRLRVPQTMASQPQSFSWLK